MSFLGSLVGRIEQGAQNAEHTISNAVHGGQPHPASTASPQQQRQIVGAINGAIGPQNGPNGAMGRATTMIDGPNGYQIPGPGAWALQQPQPNLGHLPVGVGGGLQGYTQDDLSNGLQGGVVNQGYIPLQSSGFGVGVGQGGDAQNLSLRSILNR